jgi:hypothetical protein
MFDILREVVRALDGRQPRSLHVGNRLNGRDASAIKSFDRFDQ